MHPLVAQIAYDLSADPHVRGILLTGSHARGDATQESDLDFWVLLGGVLERPFRSETLDGKWVEYHHRNLVQARERMRKNPAELYSHLDGKALYDPDGKLEELRAEAQALFAAYRLPAEERRALRYWLEGSRRKLEAALRNRDDLRAAYLASTNAWKILEGLWAACHKPMPPGGAVWAHLHDLQLDEALKVVLRDLFTAGALERGQAALALIEWVLDRLETT
ncbi:nucleotidyltransferase domain-containing protein [Calidithermus chliarophilus]|uniref:nucleotidyltransferase domain-containing protein n=1 Tax=Calidithermus chliarophilus TaxID=52023 RepID=UPI0003F92119|nr:nucleotidyltransferase domain-containing protein [Calidithermus chliarophilus]